MRTGSFSPGLKMVGRAEANVTVLHECTTYIQEEGTAEKVSQMRFMFRRLMSFGRCTAKLSLMLPPKKSR